MLSLSAVLIDKLYPLNNFLTWARQSQTIMETNKRKAADEPVEDGALNSPIREPEPKRQKTSDEPAIAPADPNPAHQAITESDRPHNGRSAPISDPGQTGITTESPLHKWPGREYFQNLYTKDPSFKYLGQKDPDFASFLDSKNQLDFTNPSAVMQLTKTLLKLDYGLSIDLPPDRLCPPVPNRHNYLLWLSSLLSSSSYNSLTSWQPVTGLDIGTGASAIYPLLACVQHRNWRWMATDIDAHSLSYAKRNVKLNGLESNILLLHRRPEQPLIPFDAPELQKRSVERIDFTMCNPPFYSSDDDMLSSAAKKSRPPLTACTGASVEMVCEGGEVRHIFRMIDESLVLREKVGWYTSMVGKVTSLETVVERLRKEKIDNYAVTELVQGTKTKRWAVGWSFGAMRPSEEAGRGVGGVWRRLLPAPVRMEVGVWKERGKTAKVVARVKTTIGALELMFWVFNGETMRGVGRARANVWSRAWRRKREREMKEAAEGNTKENQEKSGGKKDEECKLGFEVVIKVGKDGESKVSLIWREGHDQAMFESLWGYLQGKMKDI